MQFADPASVSPDAVGAALQAALNEALGEEHLLERFAPMPLFQVAIGQGPPSEVQPATAPEPGWRLTRGPWSVTATVDALTIETSAYTDWPDLRRVLDIALGTLVRKAPPKSEQRLGLRYVDRIERKDVVHPSGWAPWIESWALGAAAHEGLGEAVLSSQQQVDFDAGHGLRTTLRSAIFSDPARRGRAICQLDFDSYRVGYRPFDRADVLTAADKLWRLSLKMFQAAITKDLYEEFKRG